MTEDTTHTIAHAETNSTSLDHLRAPQIWYALSPVVLNPSSLSAQRERVRDCNEEQNLHGNLSYFSFQVFSSPCIGKNVKFVLGE